MPAPAPASGASSAADPGSARYRSPLLARAGYPLTVASAVALALALFEAGCGAPLATTLAYVLALAMTLGLEHVQPKDPRWSPPTLAAAAPDLPYLISGALVQRVVGGLVVLGATASATALTSSFGAWTWPAALSMPVRALFALLLADLGKYAVHRASHERPWLWRFHAAHHAPDRMYSLNSVRLHPINVAWNVALEVGVTALFGLDERSLVIVGALRAAVAVLQHANVALALGGWSAVFSTPELHQWHHSAVRAEADANYGATFSFWDRWLGTLVLPRDRDAPQKLGLADGGVHPRAFLRQLVWPWCETCASD